MALIFALGIGTSRRAEPSFRLIRASVTESAAEATPLININTADVQELAGLEGIGEVIAGRIAEYRSGGGHFDTVDDIMNIKGIGEKKFAAIKDAITVD